MNHWHPLKVQGFHIMIGTVLKFVWCIVLLEYRTVNSLCATENEAAPFTGGYQYHENIGYYKLYSLPSTWAYAWQQCREDGAHLVVIDSDEEYHVVWEMVKKSNADAFIGVHDLFFEGKFFTVTGKPLVPSSYNKWYKDEPNNYQEQDCVLLAKNGEIWDGKCTDHFSFICELELNQCQCN